MEKPSLAPKYKRRWQFGIYAVSILLMIWDLLFTPPSSVLVDFKSYSPYFLFIAFPLLGISWLLALKSPPLAARSAVVASTISFVSYLIIGFINLFNFQYYALDILRFYLLRIFSSGAVLIYSHRILQSPTNQSDLLIPLMFFKLRWTPKVQKYVIYAFILMFGILGIQWLYPRASCAVIGGTWIRDGMLGQAQYCLHSYPDAGKACQSSEDCMGRCLLDTDTLAATGAMPTAGVCAPDNRGYGCFSYFGDEAKYSGCVD